MAGGREVVEVGGWMGRGRWLEVRGWRQVARDGGKWMEVSGWR